MSKKESVPKYPSQIDEMNAIDKIFSKTLKQRDNIIKRNSKANRDIIRTLDLKISICIKKNVIEKIFCSFNCWRFSWP